MKTFLMGNINKVLSKRKEIYEKEYLEYIKTHDILPVTSVAANVDNPVIIQQNLHPKPMQEEEVKSSIILEESNSNSNNQTQSVLPDENEITTEIEEIKNEISYADFFLNKMNSNDSQDRKMVLITLTTIFLVLLLLMPAQSVIYLFVNLFGLFLIYNKVNSIDSRLTRLEKNLTNKQKKRI
jgi:hypothetical protein